MPKVLLLGAGLVAAPAVRYLAAHGLGVTIAANNPDRARELLGDLPGEVVDWSADDRQTLSRLLRENQVAISLLPATMHIPIARACIDARRSLVTASYASQPMRALDAEARAHGVTLLTEMGLDPGIDHMSAMRLIDDARGRGEEVLSFRSYCGGVPAVTANNNPWGYKFSWSPEGVLRATLSSMRYRVDGEVVELPPEKLEEACHALEIDGLPAFEAYPNRDSIGYESIYGIGGVKTILRGTLRWPGWCAGVSAFRRLALLEGDPLAAPSWPALIARRVGVGADVAGEALRDAVARYLDVDASAPLITQLAFLGLFDADREPARNGESTMSALARRMSERMSYAAGEHDLIVMHHELITRRQDGAEVRYTSSLVVEGRDEETAMAKTVGIPAAIGARLLLEGGAAQPGTRVPVKRAVYEPALRALEAEDIVFSEQTETRPARRG